MNRSIVDVAAIDCTLVDAAWPFAITQASDIEHHWQRRLEANPHLYNGAVLLLHHGSVVARAGGESVFKGACFTTDFKSFMAWREFGFPDTDARNIFSMAALESSDGAFLLGEMASHTAPAGQIYFPSGTPDLGDVRQGRVDIEGSTARELAEETGLTSDQAMFSSGLTLLFDRVRVCCMKAVRVDRPAIDIKRQIEDWLALDPRPELARMHIVRSSADFRPTMPDFVTDYLDHRLASM